MMRSTSPLQGICIFGLSALVNRSPIYLSGNYVTPLNMESDSESEFDDEEGLYDLSPDEDELLLEDDDSEEDELDDIDEDELNDLKNRIEET
jgi:FK506-binding nuclear protein